MTTLAELIERVDEAPRGPDVVACFDYDGTLIDGFSARAFYEHRLRRAQVGYTELLRLLVAMVDGIDDGDEFAEFLAVSLRGWRGRSVEELDKLGTRLFRDGIAAKVHNETLQLVDAHQAAGHTVVLASSATPFQVAPAARELGIEHVLCTQVEVDGDGRLTGRALGAPLWGEAKAAAFADLVDELGADPRASFVYSNGTEDVPLLEAGGRPAAIAPENGLREIAHDRGWPVLDCEKRGGRPGVTELVRTAGFWGGMAGSFGVGVGLGLLNRSRKTALDVAIGVGADVSLAAAGVQVEVVSGEEHLWSARPCVFVLNHQSKLDPPIIMKLLRRDFTGVAKKEAKNVPLFGQLFQLAGVAFVDRGNTAQAKRVLEPAIAKVRDEGYSLAIAPEGTRSATARLGRFKKGAFHIAMQAGVPMVPIVIRNAGEVQWRGAQTIHPGRVEVCVLPPIDTSGWSVETLDEHVADVRGQYLATLADWPAS